MMGFPFRRRDSPGHPPPSFCNWQVVILVPPPISPRGVSYLLCICPPPSHEDDFSPPFFPYHATPPLSFSSSLRDVTFTAFFWQRSFLPSFSARSLSFSHKDRPFFFRNCSFSGAEFLPPFPYPRSAFLGQEGRTFLGRLPPWLVLRDIRFFSVGHRGRFSFFSFQKVRRFILCPVQKVMILLPLSFP